MYPFKIKLGFLSLEIHFKVMYITNVVVILTMWQSVKLSTMWNYQKHWIDEMTPRRCVRLSSHCLPSDCVPLSWEWSRTSTYCLHSACWSVLSMHDLEQRLFIYWRLIAQSTATSGFFTNSNLAQVEYNTKHAHYINVKHQHNPKVGSFGIALVKNGK